MNEIKKYWWLIGFIFGLGVWSGTLQYNVFKINDKLDKKEYENDREKDQLKAEKKALQDKIEQQDWLRKKGLITITPTTNTGGGAADSLKTDSLHTN